MSKMANPLCLKLQQRIPVVATVYSYRACITKKQQRKWSSEFRPPRRLVLGLGASFWAQFMSMSSAGGGGKSFIASARQKGAVEEVLKNVEWPAQFPFKEEDFQRFDESSDSLFYEAPRFVTHIDDPAIAALTKYYSEVFPPSNTPGVSILDMCSSWVSHFPKGYKQERIVGQGMNEEELKQNPVSVDYLTKPLDVFKEMCRILKPGGLAIMSFSNRCFWTKAISIWTSTGDADHVLIVGSYFHYAGGFEPPQAVDISPNPGRSDPMYIVYSRKKHL
ncbi:uncharacterized protein LOC105637867 isoform X2 [Jatropha curcas]|uniref:uncharacterized protein LOC105637867 isoform X2 n=1 Tax=Jatropha curcas TaxID=180498 RepID=UPI001895150A|nr:uncharacterized protein LOC105637867 isoform X2 [Jatropha curcas]